jgi:hypothetical protein
MTVTHDFGKFVVCNIWNVLFLNVSGVLTKVNRWFDIFGKWLHISALKLSISSFSESKPSFKGTSREVTFFSTSGKN